MKFEPDIVCYNVDWEGVDKVRILSANHSLKTCRVRSIECPWTYSTTFSALYETEKGAKKAFEKLKSDFVNDIVKDINSPEDFFQFIYNNMMNESISDALKKDIVKKKAKEYFGITVK